MGVVAPQRAATGSRTRVLEVAESAEAACHGRADPGGAHATKRLKPPGSAPSVVQFHTLQLRRVVLRQRSVPFLSDNLVQSINKNYLEATVIHSTHPGND